MNGKILTIAGSDPSGGAGIQADIKTISALGGYAMAAITAITVQNTQKVYEVHPVPASVLDAQIKAVVEDIRPDAIKVGMMASIEIVSMLALKFADLRDIPLIVDPVILSSSGHELLEKRAMDILISDIFPYIHLLTPNLAEAMKLSGLNEVDSLSQMKRAGEIILSQGPQAVLIKGGHMSGDMLTDVLLTQDGIHEFTSPKILTKHTHGTGCTLSSAIATGLGQGMTLKEAVERAHQYVHKAILNAPGYGHGHGPLNHIW